MAKAERKSNPFGWILLGVLIGGIATAGVLMIASSMNVDGGYEQGPSEIRTAADDAATAATTRSPILAGGAPKPETPATAPVATVAAPAAATPSPVDAQMADDAAAAGMTSRAEQEHPTN